MFLAFRAHQVYRAAAKKKQPNQFRKQCEINVKQGLNFMELLIAQKLVNHDKVMLTRLKPLDTFGKKKKKRSEI